MTSRVLPSTAARLLPLVARAQAEGRLPSVTAGVVRDGGLVWSAARGRAVSAAGGAGAGPDTQYRIGSITKTFTVAIVLQLCRDGAVRLEDRVDTYIPDVPFGDATLRGLLAHDAGLPAEPRGPWWERSRGVDGATLIAANTDASRVLGAGEQYHYSNLGYALLGQVVEQVTDLTWWDAVRGRLLEPLAMSRTTYAPTAPYADGFSVDALAGTLTREPHQDTGAMAPAGQLWSTLTDLATWLGVLAGGAPDVLGPAELRAMTTAQSADADERLTGAYGLGLRLAGPGPRVLVGHTGSMPGFVCGAFVDRDTGVGAVVLANGAYGLAVEALTRELIETMLAHEPHVVAEWAPTPSLDAATAELLGTWHWGHMPFEMNFDGRVLQLSARGSGRRFDFTPVGVDEYRGLSGYQTAETMRVVRRADGSISHLDVGTHLYTRSPYDLAVDYPGRADDPT